MLVEHIDVRVDGPGESDPLFQRILRQAAAAAPAQRLNHKSYEDIKGDLQRTAATYGYFDAKLIRNELVVDPPNHKANIALEMDTGERYRFGTTTIKQKVIRDSLVRRYLRYHDGEPFDLTQVLRTQFALDDAQYFANLEVLPGEPDRTAHTVPVNISADASRRHRYSVGGGYATDTGVRGTLGFDDHRINSSGHTFSIGDPGSPGHQVQPAGALHHPGRRPGGGELLDARQPSSSATGAMSRPTRCRRGLHSPPSPAAGSTSGWSTRCAPRPARTTTTSRH